MRSIQACPLTRHESQDTLIPHTRNNMIGMIKGQRKNTEWPGLQTAADGLVKKEALMPKSMSVRSAASLQILGGTIMSRLSIGMLCTGQTRTCSTWKGSHRASKKSTAPTRVFSVRRRYPGLNWGSLCQNAGNIGNGGYRSAFRLFVGAGPDNRAKTAVDPAAQKRNYNVDGSSIIAMLGDSYLTSRASISHSTGY